VTRIEQPAGVPDAAEVLKAIGDVAYEWRLDTDALVWSGNAASVLGVADIASGRNFAQKVAAEDGQSRLDAITQSGQSDAGEGVPYQVQYVFRRGSGKKSGWRTPAAGSQGATASRCARSEPCVRSLRAMNASRRSSNSRSSMP